VPQARARNIERLGRYHRTLRPGLNFVIPFADRVYPAIDLREQVVSFRPQPVITEDNLVVEIDTVLYFQVTEPRAAAYEIASYLQAVEQLTVTTLRNVVGSMDLERTLTSRDTINSQLRGVLDDATGKWGLRVNRVEIKAIDPPATIKDAMGKQMRAERAKRTPSSLLTSTCRRCRSSRKGPAPPCSSSRARSPRPCRACRARSPRHCPSHPPPMTTSRPTSRTSAPRRTRHSPPGQPLTPSPSASQPAGIGARAPGTGRPVPAPSPQSSSVAA
jgi:hypothetical protein